ncbi:MAG: NADP-dependent oxidoreductase [Proteobacteria bacterium]|nr:NADP-dependent oxidoreductase [Pseudomonadota bacterium]
MTTYQKIVLASRPQGQVTPDNFRLETADVPPLQDGQVLVHNHYLSLDPYMRGRMSDAKSYAPPQALGDTMVGGTVGIVVESRHPDFAPGEAVLGSLGWAEMGVADGVQLHKIDAAKAPMQAYLGVLGMTGVTAWYGLTQIMQPKAGDTVVVSAASGAVGGIVGQLAKQRGCRAVGIAGGPDKCRYVVEELGFDACIDYKAGNLFDDLKAATPNGIDSVFENVGGEILDASLAQMNPHGRIALCGLIAGYSGALPPLKNVRVLLTMRVKLEGFIVFEHLDCWPQALQELGAQLAAGKLIYRESVAQGLVSAPQAFIGLLQGKNLGKQLVKLV